MAPFRNAFPVFQTHGCLSERVEYHGYWYSTICNRISWFLYTRYNVNPPNLQKKCGNCMQIFSVHHVLSCPNGGLFIARHNEIRDNIIHLSKQDFSPKCVCGKPLIRQGRSRSEEEVFHGGSVPETHGDVSIWCLWVSQPEVNIDIRFGDSDADYWKPVIMDKLLAGC